MKEKNEPNCDLFIYEPICYMRYDKLFFVDLMNELTFIDLLRKMNEELD